MHVGIDVAEIGKRRKPLAVIGDFNASDIMVLYIPTFRNCIFVGLAEFQRFFKC